MKHFKGKLHRKNFGLKQLCTAALIPISNTGYCTYHMYIVCRNVLYEPDYDDFTDFEEPLVMTEIPTALPRTYRSTCQLEMNVNLNLQ